MYYALPVGSTRPEREQARARTEHLVAADRWADALARYVVAGVPITRTPTGTPLPTWSPKDIRIMLHLQAALDDLIKTRRSYDAGPRPPPEQSRQRHRPRLRTGDRTRAEVLAAGRSLLAAFRAPPRHPGLTFPGDRYRQGDTWLRAALGKASIAVTRTTS